MSVSLRGAAPKHSFHLPRAKKFLCSVFRVLSDIPANVEQMASGAVPVKLHQIGDLGKVLYTLHEIGVLELHAF